jgi:tRNA(Arg) A34 adenosine deaminase TadA
MDTHEIWSFPELTISLPDWITTALPEQGKPFVSDESKMMVAITLSRLNCEFGTGGPFGAAIFNRETGTLVAPGVNLVQSLGLSGAHAEMVAIALAQKKIGSYDLGSKLKTEYELFSSTEPCAMCMGCITWSGITRLVCGASDADARSIGFDEGVKASDWIEQFKQRGILVDIGICREEAVSVLHKYKAEGGFIYNGRTLV